MLKNIEIVITSKWRMHWGARMLPPGSRGIGVIAIDGQPGVLIRLKNGEYVQGKSGSTIPLDKEEIEQAMFGDYYSETEAILFSGLSRQTLSGYRLGRRQQANNRDYVYSPRLQEGLHYFRGRRDIFYSADALFGLVKGDFFCTTSLDGFRFV